MTKKYKQEISEYRQLIMDILAILSQRHLHDIWEKVLDRASEIEEKYGEN